MHVYIIRNLANNKMYVGKTVMPNLQRYFRRKINRALRGESVGTSKLFDAMRSHGVGVFKIIPIATAESDDELCRLEKMWIDRLDTRKFGYNICEGGRGIIKAQTAETREKIRRTMLAIGWKPSPEHVAMANVARRGSRHTLESRQKMRLAALGRKCSAETRAKMSASQKLRGPDSPEVRERKRLAAIKRGVSQSFREQRWRHKKSLG